MNSLANIIYSRDNIVPILQRCVALKIVVQCVVGSASCVAPTMLEELCTFLRYASAIKEQKKCWESWLKSLTGLKCCATTLNYKQQQAIGWANGNLTMLRPFARGLSDRFHDDEASLCNVYPNNW